MGDARAYAAEPRCSTARVVHRSAAVRIAAKGLALEGDAPRGRSFLAGLRVPGERGGYSDLLLPGEVQWQSRRSRKDHRRRHQGAVRRARADLG